jgi:hypothetical protein
MNYECYTKRSGKLKVDLVVSLMTEWLISNQCNDECSRVESLLLLFT